eukprot:jgi/Tetstr1/445931/TSEL_033560.t1
MGAASSSTLAEIARRGEPQVRQQSALESPFLGGSQPPVSPDMGSAGSEAAPATTQYSIFRRAPSTAVLSNALTAEDAPVERGEPPREASLKHTTLSEKAPSSPMKKARGGKGQPNRLRQLWADSRVFRAAVRLAVGVTVLCAVSRLLCVHHELLPANSGVCAALPLWVSGLSWLPLNTPAAVISPTGAVFDRFHSAYDCTAAASTKRHFPQLLFETPKLGSHPQGAQLAVSPPPTGEQLDLLIGILSGCKSRALRDAVRETWLRIDADDHGKWRAVFIVGNCKDELADEQAMYGDLLFTSVEESYYALTGKVLDFFDYAAMVGAKYTMKTDDDTFVFVDRMLSELQGMEPQCLYWGSAFQGFLPPFKDTFDNSKPMQVLSVPTVKWYIPEQDYRRISEVPYMAGGAYILSTDLVAKVVAAREGVPHHLPEDATIAALIGLKASQECSCRDSRHVKDVDSFQGLRLLSPDGLKADASDCDVSNVVYRTISIHGVRKPGLHHKILKAATDPLDKCTDQDAKSKAKAKGLRYTGNKYEAIWGRLLRGRGPVIYMQANAYNQMVNTAPDKSGDYCKKCTKDRLIPYEHSLAIMEANQTEKTPFGFWHTHNVLDKARALPDTKTSVSMRLLLDKYMKSIPLCARVLWVSQIAEKLQHLSKHQLLLCDMSLERVYVNTTTSGVVISAGKAQWTYSEGQRFHSDAWCFSDVQCHACFKTAHNMPMDWLPEATCNAETKQCNGFDGSSQAVAAIRNVILPLLSSTSDTSATLVSRIASILEHRPPADHRRSHDKLVAKLSEEIKEYAASGKAQLHCSHSQHAKLANVLTKAARDANSLTRKLVNI